jgi:hypothetical protein
MIRLAALLLLVPGLAHAAERRWLVTSFDRVRVDGPFEVRVVPGSPAAHATGDPRMLDVVDVHQNGSTVVVQASTNGWGEQGRGAQGRTVVELATPSLVGASVSGSGKLALEAVRGPAAMLTVGGAGELSARDVQAERLVATVVGTGRMTLAGRAQHGRLSSNGTGAIDAGALETSDLVVRLDGAGEIHGQARYTADVTSTGVGSVTVDGHATCRVQAPAGPVRCGDQRATAPGE